MGIQEDIGRTFVEARRNRGLSVEDISRTTRIHSRVIKDIEGGVLDRLGKPYIKGFLKKYSKALDLDEAEIIRKYEKAAASMPAKEFVFEEEAPKDKSRLAGFLPGMSMRDIQTTTAVLLAVIIVILASMLFGRIRAGVIRAREEKKVELLKSVPVRPVVKRPEKMAPPPVKEVKKIVPILKKKPAAKVELTLRANDEVWMDVGNADGRLFVGTLKSGESVTFTSDDAVTVFSGKAGELDFTLNGHNLGTVATGVVKDIKVFPSGVKVGGAWVKRVE